MKKSLKKKLKMTGYAAVGAALVILCGASVVAKKMNTFTDSGRVISLDELYTEPAHENAYAKITYEEMTGKLSGGDGLTQEERDKKALLTQQERDRMAMESLQASVTETSSLREEIKARDKKYKLNDTNVVQETQVVQVAGLSPTAVPVTGTTEGAEYLGEFSLTAYCPCMICCGNTSGITASGARATANHTIAADSRFPFGTKLLINGVVYTVEDRGGAIKGNIIDVFFCTHEEACQFGRQSAHVYRIP